MERELTLEVVLESSGEKGAVKRLLPPVPHGSIRSSSLAHHGSIVTRSKGVVVPAEKARRKRLMFVRPTALGGSSPALTSWSADAHPRWLYGTSFLSVRCPCTWSFCLFVLARAWCTQQLHMQCATNRPTPMRKHCTCVSRVAARFERVFGKDPSLLRLDGGG